MALVRQEQTVERVEKVVVDVLCDRCGGTCVRERFPTEGGAELLQTEKATVRASWGYFSDKDLESWDADLCEGCADELKEWIDAGAGAGLRVHHAH